MRTRKWLLAHCPNDAAVLLDAGITADGIHHKVCPVCPYEQWERLIPTADLRVQIGSGLLPA